MLYSWGYKYLKLLVRTTRHSALYFMEEEYLKGFEVK